MTFAVISFSGGLAFAILAAQPSVPYLQDAVSGHQGFRA